jgi:predicted amidophosphoribosyltransferase
MKSGNASLSLRLTRIDELMRREHYYLTADDECFFFGEYLPREGYGASPTNRLIFNYKKSVARRGQPEYVYKERAIKDVSGLLGHALSPHAVRACTFVPVPPSKVKRDVLYDDRLVQSLQGVPGIDVRELLVLTDSARAHHEYQPDEKRPTPGNLYAILEVDPACLHPPVQQTIVLFDDVLTTGAHFKACKQKLKEALPGRPIIGLFIGRRKLSGVTDAFDNLSV